MEPLRRPLIERPSDSSAPQPHDHEESMASGRKRVGFTPATASSLSYSQSHTPEAESSSAGHNTPLQRSDVSHEELTQSVHSILGDLYTGEPVHNVQKPRPAIRKMARSPPHQPDVGVELQAFGEEKIVSGIMAQRRAAKLSKSVGTFSAPGSRRNSSELLMAMSPTAKSIRIPQLQLPMDPGYDSAATTDTDEPEHMREAKQLYRQHTMRAAPTIHPDDLYHSDIPASGRVTPTHDVEIEDEHVPRPTKFRTGVLGTLLRTSHAMPPPVSPDRSGKAPAHGRDLSHDSRPLSGLSTAGNSPPSTPPESGYATPWTPTPGTPRPGTPTHKRRSWYNRGHNHSVTSVSKLIESSSMLASPAQRDMGLGIEEQYKRVRPVLGKRTNSGNSVTTALSKFGKSRRDDEYKIKIHLAGTLARQNYLRRLCRALMMYGAPTHRLEEYMNMSARVLEIEAQFLYMPGCMIVAFDDSSVHTSEVKLVRTSQGVDLGKLRDVHSIYKDVVHDRIGVEEASTRLEAIISRKAKFDVWLRVPVYGLASAMVGPFAFKARPIDLPFCFLLGCLLGWLQLIVSPGNELISNVFEIGAAVITSFLARALGSIPGSDGKPLFCFSAMAQSSIALILPGFTVLSASLELQSKHIVAGSVRMVYAIIYSLFLGFGITIGTVLFGMMYENATSETTCHEPMESHWYYLFVLGFSLCLMVINQAKWKQVPAMMFIALVGYVVNFHSSQYFKGNAQVSNTLGALAIGIAANIQARFGRHVENWSLDLWESTLRPRWIRLRKRWIRRRFGPQKEIKYERSHSRNSSVASEPYVPYQRKIGYGLAAAAMLPAIFVQVPSGLSVQGSLISGITSADQIVRNTTGTATVSDDTVGGTINSVALNVGFSVIQIAIGITVGLFLAALIVYPLGKRRSGLFSF